MKEQIIYSREVNNFKFTPFRQYDKTKNFSNFLIHKSEIVGDWSKTKKAYKIKLRDKFIAVSKNHIWKSSVHEDYFELGICPTFTYSYQLKTHLKKGKISALKLLDDLHSTHFKNEANISFNNILQTNFEGYAKAAKLFLENYIKKIREDYENLSVTFKREEVENDGPGSVKYKKIDKDSDPPWQHALESKGYEIEVKDNILLDTDWFEK